MKKILSLMLALLLLCSLVACSDDENKDGGAVDLTVTNADRVYRPEGNTNDDQYYYDYVNGDEVAITGFAASHVPHAITIPNSIDDRPVTEIANGAFKNMTNVTEVTLPGTLTRIGDMAFSDCTVLTKVSNMPLSVTYVGKMAFANTQIATLDLPNAVVTLGMGAFHGCTQLTSVKLPLGLTEIPAQAFWGCTALSTVQWSNAIEVIGDSAFFGCKALRSTPVLAATATSIGAYAFADCVEITEIAIPASVTSIGKNAFYGCEKLASVTFSNLICMWHMDPAITTTAEQLLWLTDAAQNATYLTDTERYGGVFTRVEPMARIHDAKWEISLDKGETWQTADIAAAVSAEAKLLVRANATTNEWEVAVDENLVEGATRTWYSTGVKTRLGLI